MQRVTSFALGQIRRLTARRPPGANDDLRLPQQRSNLVHDRRLDLGRRDPAHNAGVAGSITLQDPLGHVVAVEPAVLPGVSRRQWAGIFFLNGAWHAVGGAKGEQTRLLAIGERLVTLAAADDWLNTYETDETAHKSRRWLREPPTDRQLAHLPPAARADLGMTRYQASALLTFKFNRQDIRRLVMSARPALRQAA